MENKNKIILTDGEAAQLLLCMKQHANEITSDATSEQVWNNKIESPVGLVVFGENQDAFTHFESVTISREGQEISISSHMIRENQLKSKMKSDRLLYKATALDESATSSAEQPMPVGSPSSDYKGRHSKSQ